MIGRAECEHAFRAAVAACDPARLVRGALHLVPRDRDVYAIAIGKAALAMARGAGAGRIGFLLSPPYYPLLVAPGLD